MEKRGSWIQRAKDLAAEYAYLATLVCVLAVIAGSAAYTQRVRQEAATVEAAAGAPEVAQTHSPVPEAKITPLPTIAPLAVHMSVLGGEMIWPIEGEVLRGFDAQDMVHWKTLGVWQAHQGIDIAGKEGENVLCAGDGVVQSVMRDAMWGASVKVQLSEGRSVIYRGLALCFVREGQSLRCGQQIGTLAGAVPCEAEMDAHLHMETVHGGILQDPMASLQER